MAPWNIKHIYCIVLYLLNIKCLCVIWLFNYRYVPIGTVGQESLWTLNSAVLQNNFVAARSWGVMNLNEVLIGPGFHVVLFKLPHHLVCQSVIARRTSPVADAGKLTGIGRNEENRKQ